MGRKRLELFENDLEVFDINKLGMGVSKTNEGVICFIKNAVPGDIVDVKIFKKRKGYFEAEPIRWLKKSAFRTQPICQHFGICGGCKLQHISYEGQLKFKENSVLNDLNHIGKTKIEDVLPIVGSKNQYYYRNKLEFSFSNNRWLTSEEILKDKLIDRNGLGFHKPGMWDKIVDIEKCHLQANPSNEIRNTIKDFAQKNKLDFFNPRKQSGLLRSLMIRNTIKGELMVLVQFYKEDKEMREALLSYIFSKFPKINSLLYCINSKANDSIYDQKINVFKGEKFITEYIGKLKFKITAKSFFQTNPEQAKVLYSIVKDFASIKSHEIVYDLYTGTGTIALILANLCSKIIGIESVPEAIEAAKDNAKHNKVENIFFETGDIKNLFNDDFIKKYGKADVLITDPPRSGMHSNVIKQILKLEPNRIVYVSCNSSTQARDIIHLKEKYFVIKSQAIDMFPQTPHVENVVLLYHKNLNEKY
tara:strand:- start:6410 stop:7834 length:1425 start_codon:yes stop_codon:yes gene_type:complete